MVLGEEKRKKRNCIGTWVGVGDLSGGWAAITCYNYLEKSCRSVWT